MHAEQLFPAWNEARDGFLMNLFVFASIEFGRRRRLFGWAESRDMIHVATFLLGDLSRILRLIYTLVIVIDIVIDYGNAV